MTTGMPAPCCVAVHLRQKGYHVVLDARNRSVQVNIRDAERRGCAAFVMVGDDERHVQWHDLRPEWAGDGANGCVI